jgi:hypothetical protein
MRMFISFLNYSKRTVLVAVLPLFLMGCGAPKLVPVSGKVTQGGKPVTSGLVVYSAVKSGDKLMAITGQIKEDGTYALQTDGKDGAPLGKYKVFISPMAGPPTPPTGPGPKKEFLPGKDPDVKKEDQIPNKYKNAKDTPFEKVVVDGVNTFDIPIE